MLEPHVEALSALRATTLIQDLLGSLGDVTLTVTGGCMAPALPEGVTVSLARAGSRRPRLGDVVLVRLPTGLRLHRLVWGPPLARGRWRTKGDRALLWDPAVEPTAVLTWVREADAGRQPVRAAGAALRSLSRGLLARLRSAFRGALPS